MSQSQRVMILRQITNWTIPVIESNIIFSNKIKKHADTIASKIKQN